jgi:hypothetical protein
MCGLGEESFTSLGESDRASVPWRSGNVVHTFIVASALSELDVVIIEVEVQKVLQGLRIAKKNTRTCVDVGLDGSARAGMLDVHTTAKGAESKQICFATRTEHVKRLDCSIIRTRNSRHKTLRPVIFIRIETSCFASSTVK